MVLGVQVLQVYPHQLFDEVNNLIFQSIYIYMINYRHHLTVLCDEYTALELSDLIYSGQTITSAYSEEEEDMFQIIEGIAQKLLTIGNEESNTSEEQYEENVITAESLADELVQLILEP